MNFDSYMGHRKKFKNIPTKEKSMEIRNFNYFDDKQITNGRNAVDQLTDKDFDLDLQTVDHPVQGGGSPIVNGSGHFWCHPTDDNCTEGPICATIVSLIAC